MSTMGEILDVIKDEKAAGTTTTAIATKLNKKGFTTPRGVKWAPHSVSYFANKSGIRWRRKSSKRATKAASLVVGGISITATTNNDWINYVREIRTSNLSGKARTALTWLIIDSIA